MNADTFTNKINAFLTFQDDEGPSIEDLPRTIKTLIQLGQAGDDWLRADLFPMIITTLTYDLSHIEMIDNPTTKYIKITFQSTQSTDNFDNLAKEYNAEPNNSSFNFKPNQSYITYQVSHELAEKLQAKFDAHPDVIATEIRNKSY